MLCSHVEWHNGVIITCLCWSLSKVANIRRHALDSSAWILSWEYKDNDRCVAARLRYSGHQWRATLLAYFGYGANLTSARLSKSQIWHGKASFDHIAQCVLAMCVVVMTLATKSLLRWVVVQQGFFLFHTHAHVILPQASSI